MGLSTIRIMTNNPRKIVGIEGYGLRVVGRVPIQIPSNRHTERYLLAKKRKLGHLLELPDRHDSRKRGSSHLSLRERAGEAP